MKKVTYLCDRCGAEVDEAALLVFYDGTVEPSELHFCSDCRIAFDEWRREG